MVEKTRPATGTLAKRMKDKTAAAFLQKAAEAARDAAQSQKVESPSADNSLVPSKPLSDFDMHNSMPNEVAKTNPESEECGLNLIQPGLKSENQPGLILDAAGKSTGEQSGLKSENQPGLFSEDTSNPTTEETGLILNQPAIGNADETAAKENQPGLISDPVDSSDQKITGLISENQPGLIATSDTVTAQKITGPIFENQPGLNLNQPGLIYEDDQKLPENQNQPGLFSNQPGLKSQNQPGLISDSEGPPATDSTDQRLRQLYKLKGNELAVLQFLKTRIQTVKTLETDQVKFREITSSQGITYEAARTAIQQSVGKALIERVEVRQGAQGWVRYRMSNDVYTFLQAGQNKSGLKSLKQPGLISQNQPGLISRSSSIKNLDSVSVPTTTADYDWIPLVEIPPAAQEYITESHLRQLARFGFNSEALPIMQQSLDNLASCIEAGHKYEKGAATVFVSVMKKSGYFDAPDSYAFNQKRAQMKFERDREALERAVESEVIRIAHERFEADQRQPETGNRGLDDIPF